MGGNEAASDVHSIPGRENEDEVYDLKGAEPTDEKKKEREDDLEKPNIGNFFRVLSYATSVDWVFMGAAATCSIGAGVTLPLMNIVFGHVVRDFNGYFIPGSTVTTDQFLSAVNKNALYIIYLFIGKFVLTYISMFSFRMTGLRISATLRLRYLQCLFAQPISIFDNLPSGKAIDIITASSNTIQIGISEKLAILIQFLALVVGAYVVAFRYSWALTLVSSSTILFVLIVYSVTTPMHIKKQHAVDKANEEASSIAGEVFGSIRTIVACGAESRLADRYAVWIKEAKIRGLRMSPIIGGQWAPAFFAIYSNFALAFWFGVRLYSRGSIANSGTVVTVFFSVLLVVSALGNIAAPIIGISKAASASTGFFTVIDAPVPKIDGIKEPEASPHEDITFHNVTFAYPSRPNVKVLDGLNVTFAKGKITAIVGPSGSGKSTIVALLERWYQLSQEGSSDPMVEGREQKDSTEWGRVALGGSVMVGSHEIQDLDLKWWRSQIGLVQQEPFSFNDTIYKNVEYGLVGSRWENETDEVKKKLIEDACREAFADEFINRLPLGYQTMIGENGIKLSGGQRQRLAIARSIIKRPAILILDEATSSIDVRGERIVQEALDRVSKNRTTITIAHRLSTIKKANNIIVFKNGTAVEQGTHESLLSNEKGVYYELVHAQQLMMADSEDAPLIDDVDELYRTVTGKSQDEVAVPVTEDQVQRSGPEYKSRGVVNTVGLFLYEQRAQYLYYSLILVAAMGAGAGFAIQSFLFAKIMTVFQYMGQKLISGGNFWSLMFFVEAIAVSLCYFTLGWFANSAAVKVVTTYRQQYLECILRQPISFYDAEDHSAGTLTSRLSTDPNQLQELLGPNMCFPLIALFNVTGCVAISFAFGWKLTLVTMFSGLPVIFVAGFIRIRYEVQFEKLNAQVFAESSKFASESIGAFRTVTSLTLENTITNRYDTLLREHVRNAFNKARFATLIFSGSDSVELLCMALCFWYGGKLLSTRAYTPEQFFVVYIAIIMGGQAAGQWCSFAPSKKKSDSTLMAFINSDADMAQANAAANRILSFREVPQPSSQKNSTIPSTSARGPKIELSHVKFKYPTRDVPVFKDLNLLIEAGQFAALVGPSGCGKTTVVTLLERFYEAQSGSITLDGVDISTLDMAAYRKSLSLVSQEPTLYRGSVRDNVLLGVNPSDVIEKDIQQACKDAEIHDFITSLPDGYDTDVGLKGVALSGGQKQRICIARALIRKPRVLLLDEATSSLDSESEKLVQAAFERAAKGRTMLVVAHRLATVQNADVIFVFGDGKVLEKGSHGELLRRRGLYWQMCQSQALDR